MSGRPYKEHIREIPDFPRPGIKFKDITPLLRNGPMFRDAVDEIGRHCEEASLHPEYVACPEARGFIFGAALAYRLGAGFVPVRKPGKLPFNVKKAQYELEYGTDTVEVHVDAVEPQSRVLLVDDLLATGGTMGACIDLLRESGADLLGCIFLVELAFLDGRDKLAGLPVHSLVTYS